MGRRLYINGFCPCGTFSFVASLGRRLMCERLQWKRCFPHPCLQVESTYRFSGLLVTSQEKSQLATVAKRRQLGHLFQNNAWCLIRNGDSARSNKPSTSMETSAKFLADQATEARVDRSNCFCRYFIHVAIRLLRPAASEEFLSMEVISHGQSASLCH
ncbi:hypothetical protein PIB30_017985 [Stylosanthes scabra]|uniref:Uncharacterized protein n=1 Tax=Stylosanthes scabra TaxID=79078 RepID=A0ABU6U6K7_9FABA|nr:hypothetical protein [Stylosanthes scabra]